jgi:hypothetical protein
MTFQMFLETLPKLAKMRYSQEFATVPSQAMKRIIDDHMVPLYDEITSSKLDALIDEDSL